MREILFRGKAANRIDGYTYRTKYKNGDWVFGLLTKNENYLGYAEMTNTNRVSGIEIDKNTVEQYIGVNDNTGSKIFEGDIVKYGDMVGVINYFCGCFCIKTTNPDWKNRNNPAIDIVINEYPNEIEIIGNIHDNPDLLDGGRNVWTI